MAWKGHGSLFELTENPDKVFPYFPLKSKNSTANDACKSERRTLSEGMAKR